MRLAALVLLVAVSCSRAPSAGKWAMQAANGHDQADELIDRGDREGARGVLETIVAEAPREGPADTRRVLLQDTRFRLARLALEAGQAAQAIAHADAGLALGGDPSVFLANLLVVRGAAREVQGQSAGAVEDYQRALAINETLLKQAVPGP